MAINLHMRVLFSESHAFAKNIPRYKHVLVLKAKRITGSIEGFGEVDPLAG